MSGSVLKVLRRRAELFARAREFFAARGVLEVDTPLLDRGVVVEAHIDPVACQTHPSPGSGEPQQGWLRTSPEGPMKRLLAAGSGPVYQFAHAFRDGERGQRHAIEFILLEWYRPGFDAHALMTEVEELIRAMAPSVGDAAFERRTYRQVFVETAGIDPFEASVEEIRAACEKHGVAVPSDFATGSRDDALDVLLVGHVEPVLGRPRPMFVHDYPASQAALARTGDDDEGHRVAARFELYIDGVELANGYHELADAAEQRARFEAANRERAALGRPQLPVDEPLLDALASGSFPDCAGVALGFDRLAMIVAGVDDIDAVRAFTND